MKTFGICAMLALAALGAAPVMAAGPMLDKAVSLAAQDSGARLSDICYAVYKAVKESPDEADTVFSQVISQRTTWSSGEVYAIFRAVLLARPDLEEDFRNQVASYKSGQGIKGKEGAPVSSSTSGTPSLSDPMLYRLMTVLYEASLPDGVAPTVINSLVTNAVDLVDVNQNVMAGRVVGASEASDLREPTVTPPTQDIPTPAPMSPQN